jgi:hypothetical protein
MDLSVASVKQPVANDDVNKLLVRTGCRPFKLSGNEPQTNSLPFVHYCYFGNRLHGTGEKLPSKLVPTAIGWSETTLTVVDTLV